MITVEFRPQAAGSQTEASISGQNLTYNGEVIDLSTIPAGATDTNEFLTIDKDMSGNVSISMLWNYNDSTPKNRYPANLVNPADGILAPINSTGA